MKKVWMIAALFAAVTFAACGGDDKKEGEEGTEAEGTENAEEVEDTEEAEETEEETASVSVVGSWQLESVSGEELTEKEKSSVIEFKEDGTMEMRRSEGEPRKGTWTLSEDGKTLNVTKGEGGKTDAWTNVELSGDKLSFNEDEDKITLKKVK